MSKRRRPTLQRAFVPQVRNIREVKDQNEGAPVSQMPNPQAAGNMTDAMIDQLNFTIDRIKADLLKAREEVKRLEVLLERNKGALEGFMQIKQMGAEITMPAKEKPVQSNQEGS